MLVEIELEHLGPAYNEFGYCEHQAITSNFYEERTLLKIQLRCNKYNFFEILMFLCRQDPELVVPN